MDSLVDPAAERAVLAAVYAHGRDAYIDVADLVAGEAFGIDSNAALWACLDHVYQKNPDARPDLALVRSAARTLGYEDHLFGTPEERKHLRAVTEMRVNKESARDLALKLKTLRVARDLRRELKAAHDTLGAVTGEEAIDAIMAMAEGPVSDYLVRLQGGERRGGTLGAGVKDYLLHRMANPVAQVGISSGFRKWDKSIGGGLRAGAVPVVAARMKVGKALDVDALVYTPAGPVRMGDVRVGDVVCNASGRASRVVGVYPQGEVDVYRVTFSDGDSVDCCADHLWEVGFWRTGVRSVKALRDFMGDLATPAGQAKWSVRLPAPVEFRPRPVEIDPYLLGALLGNAGLHGDFSFVSPDPAVVSEVSRLLAPDHRLVQDGKQYEYRVVGDPLWKSPIRGKLKAYGLWGKRSAEKFVPADYLLNDAAVRLAVLQGLMDTDGSADQNGNCEFSTASPQLAKDVKFLVQSLGGLCRVKERWVVLDGKKFRSYRCSVRADDRGAFFRSPRKAGNTSGRVKPPLKRWVKSVELVGRRPAQCIEVDDPEALYLTDNFVVTHNTQFGMNVAKNVAVEQQIPVWYGDTELTIDDHYNRVVGNLSGVLVDELETGQFAADPVKVDRAMLAAAALEGAPYHYECIAGRPFQETLNLMRRWVLQTVGLGEDGKAKPCVLIFDYLKLMDSGELGKDLKEYQVLGFMMTSLHNFALRYGVPVLVLLQLNREGIDKEDMSAIGGSDRIGMLCTSATLLKWQSPEERAEQGGAKAARYSHKLVHLVGRHGKGMAPEEFIHLRAEYEYGRLTEGPYRTELANAAAAKTEGFRVEATGDELSRAFDGGVPLPAA